MFDIHVEEIEWAIDEACFQVRLLARVIGRIVESVRKHPLQFIEGLLVTVASQRSLLHRIEPAQIIQPGYVVNMVVRE